MTQLAGDGVRRRCEHSGIALSASLHLSPAYLRFPHAQLSSLAHPKSEFSLSWQRHIA